MARIRRGVSLLLCLLPAIPAAARAQIDYRNLEDDRPGLIEDAYSLERHAFEFLAPWRFSRDRQGTTTHAFTPELEYGVLRNAQLGVKLPIAGNATGEGRVWGLAGLKLFALYNFNTESRGLPGLALRADLTFPVGSLAGEGTRLTLKGLATRSFGMQRVHLNGAFTFGRDRALGAAEAAHKWWAGLAADHTLFRQSTLLVAELYALRSLATEPVQLNATIGARQQLTPYLVLDFGITRRLREVAGPDYEVTVGFSRAFAIPGLIGIRR